MSHLNPGLISAYNSLTDKHLAGYFSNTRIRRHLQRAGLITRSGRIVPDKEYRHKLMQRAHQRHVRECLAQAIFHKVLEMERLHQIEIKRKLEEFARRERVHKIKVERSKRYEEEIIRILSPRPPTGARGVRKQHSGPEGEHTESSESPSSSRPNTAPGKMQRLVRLKPIHSNSTTASLRRSSPHRPHEPSHGINQPFNCTMEKESRRRLNPMEASHGISPYCLPVINNFVTPVPPPARRRERGLKVTRSSTVRGRRLRPTTASSGADVSEEPPMLRSSVHQSKVSVNMMYFGKTVHLSHDLTDMRDDVKVFQQHCGGENLCVFKGRLCEGETFQFVSRRHRGFPFSLTFFLNGLQVERLSSCCEFKHRKGSRLGGRHGHFGFCGVEGASPCYKCIIAMGLDKKPTPPPKRVKEDGGRDESLSSAKDSPETERMGEDAASPSECETSQQQVEEETAQDEDKVRDEYEEDFEADDEGAADEGKSNEKKSVPLSSDSEKPIKGNDAAETEDDENDDDIKSRSGSCSSASDREESDDEAAKDPEEDENADKPAEAEQQESAAAPNEGDEPNPEQAAAAEVKPAAVKDSDMQDSAGDSTEIAVSDTSGPPGDEKRPSADDSGDKDAGEAAEGSKEEEGQERVKSVQEKLAEAILKESQCSSEPELSDTSTEESVDEGPKQGSKDAAPEKLYTIAESEQTFVAETKCEESVGGEGEAAEEQQQQEEAAAQEQRDESVQELREDSDGTKEKEAVEKEEDKKPAGAEEKEKSECTEDPGEALPSANKDNVAQDDATAGPLEDAPAESTEAASVENKQETGEQPAAETNSQDGETGQRAKSKEEADSSVSEPNKKTDETMAAADNAEEEATTASETMEMKAASPEEREAPGCEEAPVTDAAMEQRAQSEDRTPASETGATAETSSSSAGDSGDTAVEKAVGNSAESTEGDAGEKNKEEENKGDSKEESELMSETVASKDESQKECEVEEEGTEASVEIDKKEEEPKSEEDSKEKEKHSHLNETEEDKNTEEEEKNGEEEAQEGNESNLDRNKDKEVKIETGNDSNGDAEDDKEAEETLSEQNPVTEGEKNEKPEREEEEEEEKEEEEEEEEGECVRNKDEKKDSEAKETDENKEGEEMSQSAAAAEAKSDEAEKSDRDAKESKAEQAGVTDNKDDEGREEKTDVTDKAAGEGGEITESLGDADKERLEQSCEDIVQSEKVGESETAEGTRTTEGPSVHTTDGENVKSEAERASDSSEPGGIDAENGEPSVGAGSSTQENQDKVPPADRQDPDEAAERGEEGGSKTEGPHAEGPVTSDPSAGEKHEDQDAEPAPQSDAVGGDSKGDKDAAEKSDESPQEVSVPETSGTEIKGDNEELQENPKSEDRQDSEGTEPSQTTGKSNSENRESVLVEKNNNINEVIVVSSREQQQCSETKSVGGSTHQSDEVIQEPSGNSETKTDKLPPVDEGPVGLELSAAEENGADTEEVSKDSEEGASVLLKPQAQNSDDEDDEEDEAGRRDAVPKGPPEALTVADNRDLVTNWVNMHQSSKFFETFVEPLEELTEAESNKADAPPAEPLASDASAEVAKTPDDREEAPQLKDDDESREEMKVIESDLDRGRAEDKASESEAGKDPQQDVETTEVRDLLKAESEHSDREAEARQQEASEAYKESRSPPGGDETQEKPTQADSEDAPLSKAEEESVPGTLLSVVSHKPESLNQAEEKDNRKESDLNASQEATKDMESTPPSPEERHSTKSPEGHRDTVETQQGGDELQREVTEVTQLTASKSDDGSREESGEQEAKVSEESVGRDRRELIHDIKHTLSKDRLSSFSVDETLFGRGSYSLLTTARTESGH